jgi:hypothetical protein
VPTNGVQVLFHIFLESSQQGLQLCFRPCFNWRFAQEVVGFQNSGSFNFENFEILDLGVLGKMTFGATPMASHRKHYKGEGGGFPPKSGP